MREELIINGQHCDLEEDTGITLEYVSNLLNEPGKILLSHSYTVKLPRTANNARILDLPERPAHESSMVRRYLPVHYYRNGINLIGDDAHAYITSATDEQYELVLVWDDIPELRALAESDATINDLPGLPVLEWIGNSYGAETDGALFAKYTSSNAPKNTDNVNDLIHPCMRMASIMTRILNNSGLSYEIPDNSLQDVMVLAAPAHKPDDLMNLETGTYVWGYIEGNSREVYFTSVQPPSHVARLWGTNTIIYKIGPARNPMLDLNHTLLLTQGYKKFHVLATILTDASVDLSDSELRVVPMLGGDIKASEVLGRLPFIQGPNSYTCVGKLDIDIPDGVSHFGFIIYSKSAKDFKINAQPLGADNEYILKMYVDRDTIDTSYENTFPIERNLPDLKQWDFFRNCMLIGGLTPIVKRSKLYLYRVEDLVNLANAVDWTQKFVGTPDTKVSPRLSSEWSQDNRLILKEDSDEKTDRGFGFSVQDQTLKAHRDWAALDFAASQFDYAIHYKTTDEGATYEDVDIEPRFFRYDAATKSLQFTPDLYGEGLKTKYAALQAALEKPVVIEATVRLTEIDLATLDLARPVYLAQYGHYYHVLKVQTGNNDECKVELLQLR